MICRPYIRTRDGRIIYARDYGKKAFCFEEKQKTKTPSKEEVLADSKVE